MPFNGTRFTLEPCHYPILRFVVPPRAAVCHFSYYFVVCLPLCPSTVVDRCRCTVPSSSAAQEAGVMPAVPLETIVVSLFAVLPPRPSQLLLGCSPFPPSLPPSRRRRSVYSPNPHFFGTITQGSHLAKPKTNLCSLSLSVITPHQHPPVQGAATHCGKAAVHSLCKSLKTSANCGAAPHVVFMAHCGVSGIFPDTIAPYSLLKITTDNNKIPADFSFFSLLFFFLVPFFFVASPILANNQRLTWFT
eukprot:TRINITY_DN26077_c0_g1_i1.p1 TRINITY_DN26077_c0_g1~~TRINITY_DN26077_c0_g1_i1.p1  ORF type:complete len:247 (+),score=9.81 TRINITY_DN26077_c0_g1_i1:269-1009(+)